MFPAIGPRHHRQLDISKPREIGIALPYKRPSMRPPERNDLAAIRPARMARVMARQMKMEAGSLRPPFRSQVPRVLAYRHYHQTADHDRDSYGRGQLGDQR